MVLPFIAVSALVADERNEEAEFRNLYGDGLNVHAIEAILNQIELARVVVFVVGENAFNSRNGSITGGKVRDIRSGVNL